jgi:hypothetical protein
MRFFSTGVRGANTGTGEVGVCIEREGAARWMEGGLCDLCVLEGEGDRLAGEGSQDPDGLVGLSCWSAAMGLGDGGGVNMSMSVVI